MKFNLISTEKDSRPVYITGNFNNWDPRDGDFQLELLADGKYTIDIPDHLLPENIEYKFTKGGWENVEIDRYGNITHNRKIQKAEETEDIVEKWRENWAPFKKEYFPVIELISDEFAIPQLQKTRKIWALLPYNYYKSNRRYPVLYLQDAQNLFHEGSEFGNWEIDRKLSLLAEYGRGEVIIIAIENGRQDRINEYILEPHALAEDAEGKKYIRFLADTLKPYIDKMYRTQPEREFTGIGGSSLGGLISIYGGFLYPEVYSKLMIFSPSLWVNPDYDFPMMNFKSPYKTRIYMYGGLKEGGEMAERMKEFEKRMEWSENQYSVQFEFRMSFNPEGAHQEFYWSQEFPRAVEWLFFDSGDDPKEFAEKAASAANTDTENL